MACQNLIVPSTYKHSIIHVSKQISYKYHSYWKVEKHLVHMIGWTRLSLCHCYLPYLSHYSRISACFPPLRPTLWIHLKRMKLTRSKISIALYNSESHGLFHHFIYPSFKCQLLRKIFPDNPIRSILSSLPITLHSSLFFSALFY